MIRWLLRALGAQDARPEPVVARFPETVSEQNYECVRQESERTIARADRETERGRQQWGDLRFPLESVRVDDDA